MTTCDCELSVLLLVLPVMLIQSILLFIDAKKKSRFPWFWGLWGLIQFPLPTLFYLLLVVRPYKKRLKQMEEK
ncbi:transcriptional regulator [Bacillus alkalicellulosilyticus]|uniref:transcriptional regulator n=1 Tax=Alkalihalobacterium alkalicellulosilyticum TaxID=1912214 RepID=UPI0011169D5C|nr:transcriptional regulator [Bacillus alkalicellulosilyticus]